MKCMNQKSQLQPTCTAHVWNHIRNGTESQNQFSDENQVGDTFLYLVQKYQTLTNTQVKLFRSNPNSNIQSSPRCVSCCTARPKKMK